MRRRLCAWVVVAGCGFKAGGHPQPDANADSAIDTAIDAPRVDTPTDTPGHTTWWMPAWHHRVFITIDNSKLASGTLTDFPVLVTLPSPVDAASLRFVAADDTTVLAHEVDTEISGGGVIAWVRIPTLSNQGAMPTLWAYYDNASATSTSDGAMLWNSKHTAVLHLGAALTDSTGKGHDGTVAGAPAVMPGKIGNARAFDGNDSIELSGENGFDYTTHMYTSAWIKVATYDVAYQAIVTKGDTSWRLHRDNGTNAGAFDTTNGGNNDPLGGTDNTNDGAWHFIAGVMDGDDKFLYIDGVQDAKHSYNQQLDNNQFTVRIGLNPESMLGGTRNWKGLIDEVRISGSDRSAAWIKAEYVTVADPAFVAVTAPEAF